MASLTSDQRRTRLRSRMQGKTWPECELKTHPRRVPSHWPKLDLFCSRYFIQGMTIMDDQCFSCMCWYADTIQEQTCLGNMATRLMKVLIIAKKMTRNTRVLIHYQTNKFWKKPSCFPYFIVSIPLFVHRLPYSASWTIFHVRVIAKSGYIYNEQIIVIAVFVFKFYI